MPESAVIIPLSYTSLLKPSSALYETPSSDFWHPLDTTAKDSQAADCLPSLRKVVADINNDSGVKATLNESRISESIVTVLLEGPSEAISSERVRLYRSYYQVERWRVGATAQDLYAGKDTGESIDPALRDSLDSIAQYCQVSIVVTDTLDKVPYGVKSYYDQAPPSQFHILIFGDQDSCSFAHIKLRLALAQVQGKYVDSLSMNLCLQPIVAGPFQKNMLSIEQQTFTTILLMEPLPELFGSRPSHSVPVRNYDEVYIVGEPGNVAVAKTLLNDVVSHTQMISSDCVMAFIKIDLLITKYRSKVRDIMDQYGTFIQLPYFGAGRSLVRVMGTTAASVESTIEKLNGLATDFYEATYWFHTGQEDGSGTFIVPRLKATSEVVEKIAGTTGVAILSQEDTSFEICGFRADVKRAVAILHSLPVGEDVSRQVSYRMEMANDLESFIAGKKNGKLFRIMNSNKVFIRFLPFNEYNFYINLVADDNSAATSGLQLLEDELPAEIAFHVPNPYHKLIIGSGGSLIQGVMRKYNVFIKFGVPFEPYNNGLYVIRPDNVVVRCPTKNSKSLILAKQDILAMQDARIREHLNTFIYISRSHRRILLNEKAASLPNIERSTNAVIYIPENEPEVGDLVEIKGLGSTSEDAARLLKVLLPEDYEFKVAHSRKFLSTINEKEGEFYTRIVAPFRIALRIETQVHFNGKESARDAASDSPPYHRIVLSFSQENSMGLEEAIQELTTFLREHDFDIIDRGEAQQDLIETGTSAQFTYGVAPARHGDLPGGGVGVSGPRGGSRSRQDAGRPPSASGFENPSFSNPSASGSGFQPSNAYGYAEVPYGAAGYKRPSHESREPPAGPREYQDYY